MHGGFAQNLSGYSQTVELPTLCGDTVVLTATPDKGYHFSHWSDGDTSATRRIIVDGSTTYTAYFEPNCGDYAELPLVNKYDWVLMLNLRLLRDTMGYTLYPEGVKWYRVVGEVDKIRDPNDPDPPGDPPNTSDPPDTYLGSGYSFTLDKNLQLTGDYYAVVDLIGGEGTLCSGLSRTQVISFMSPSDIKNESPPPNTDNESPPPNETKIRLIPTIAHPQEIMRIVGLDPNIQTHIRVYTVVGQLLVEDTTIDKEEYLLTAYPGTGVFEVVVMTNDDYVVLKYLVRH